MSDSDKRPASSSPVDEPDAKRAATSASASSSSASAASGTRKPVRIWCDGCFDMMHYGHANALRQAKAEGDYLVVGVHSDADISLHKGPPVMNEQERYRAVRACKWVDEVVEAAPYQTELEVLIAHDIDWCIHGDDIVTTADGEDCYAKVKAANKFRTVPRTRGVSTTDLVGRMLLMTKEHFMAQEGLDSKQIKDFQPNGGEQTLRSPHTRLTQFIPSSRQIVQFSEGREPRETDKIVYVDGAFDLFHVGHIAVLEKAKELGDYLIVGVHTDQEVNRIKGSNLPIMNLHERVLGVLSCRYVDEVIIGAPYAPSEQLIRQLRISVVCHGAQPAAPCADGADPYADAKQMGIYQTVDSACEIQTGDIITRIMKNRQAYEERNRKKEAKEVAELTA